jgi:hypothetical protein
VSSEDIKLGSDRPILYVMSSPLELVLTERASSFCLVPTERLRFVLLMSPPFSC